MIQTHGLKAAVAHSLFSVLNDLFDSEVRLYRYSSSIGLCFTETSMCFVKRERIWNHTAALADVVAELYQRRELHKQIYDDSSSAFGLAIPTAIKSHFAVRADYTFSLYAIHHPEPISHESLLTLRLLSEPSLIDLDDMSSSRNISPLSELSEKIRARLQSLVDSDIAPQSSIFVTWASLLAISSSDRVHFERTLNLIVAMEIRLQMTWMRCSSLSRAVDETVRKKLKRDGLDEIYWRVVTTRDESKYVMSQTSSSRANKIFAEMIDTSGIKDEIDTLGSKIDLFERYIARIEEKQSRRFRRFVESFLAITAFSQMVPIFFAVPIKAAYQFENLTGYTMLGALLILLVLIFLQRK